MIKRRLLISVIVGAVVSGTLVAGCDSSQRAAHKAYQQGLTLKEQGKMKEAAQQFSLALDRDPHYAEAVFELGIMFCALQDYRQAVKHLLRATEYEEVAAKSYAFLGYAYERLERVSLAQNAYKQAILKAPHSIDIYLRLADLFEDQGNRQEAATLLEQVLAFKPDIENAAYLKERAASLQQSEASAALADVYIRYGEIARGLAEYQRAFSWDEHNPDSLVNFGLYCLERDQFAAAAAYLQQAKEAGRTEQIEVRAGLGIAYEALEQSQKAVEEYRAALQLSPTWYVIYVKLAQLLEQLNQNAEAAQELETLFYVSNYAAAIASTEWFANADTLWAEILRLRNEESSKTVVQFTPAGQYMLVTALVNQQVPAQVHIEQRANYTILSVELAEALGIEITTRTSEVRFELGGQTYAAPLINLPSLKIGGMEVRNIPTLIWDLSEYPGIDGFLGMTFLRHFQVEIKEQERLVILTKTYS